MSANTSESRFWPSPRPWRFDWFRGRPAIVDANSQPVAFVESTRSKFEFEKANAKHASLCVNAHEELLEALQHAVLQIEYLHDKFKETGTGNAVLEQARAAIARATGEQS